VPDDPSETLRQEARELLAQMGGRPVPIDGLPHQEAAALVPLDERSERVRHNLLMILEDRAVGIHNAMYARELLRVAASRRSGPD